MAATDYEHPMVSGYGDRVPWSGQHCPQCERIRPAGEFTGPYCSDCAEDYRPSPDDEDWRW